MLVRYHTPAVKTNNQALPILTCVTSVHVRAWQGRGVAPCCR